MLYYVESSGNWITLEALVYGAVLGAVMFVVIQWFACYNKVMTTDKFIYLVWTDDTGTYHSILSMALAVCATVSEISLKVIRNGQEGNGTRSFQKGMTSGHGLNMVCRCYPIFDDLGRWKMRLRLPIPCEAVAMDCGEERRFPSIALHKRDCCLGTLMAGLFAVFTAGCASGAAYAVYDPRIVLAGFTVQGSTAPVSVTPWLAGATYLCFGIFCFLPVMLELYESRKLKRSRKKTGTDIGMTYRQIYEELEQEGKIL